MGQAHEPLILAIETATRAGSVALARGAEVLGAASGDATASHSMDLIETVAGVLQSGGVKLSEVDLFAVAEGPGSFTGLRIGLATIKSFAVCIEKPCAGISTLAAIARSAGNSERVVALLPAGRGELFAQMFSVRDGQVKELDQAAHLSLNAILEKYGTTPEVVWAGEGAHLNAESLRTWPLDRELKGWRIAAPENQIAISIAALARNAYRDGHTVSAQGLRAVYVRASDAEINEKWQQAK
ncbi:MAG: tRNA threonylcarbamoyladenosine biosynthesis protein TsaB [Blastocatellia bacterium]|nr:tRNA threonylcarbamoyladenosine biosynthesis protein TsaB [Blastocatellia bacterium]